MAKIFADNGITAKDKVLPLSEFKLFLDIEDKSLRPEKMEAIIAEAESYLEEPIPFIPLSDYREFKITGNRNHFQSKYYKRRDMLFPMALAEYYEGKGRFTDKICDLVWAILEESSWVIHAHAIHNPAEPGADVPPVYGEENLHGVDLFSAMTAAILTTVLVYNRAALDSVSPYIAERLEYEIKKRTIRPFLSYRFGWTGEYGGKVNNWCPWIVSNVLYVTALLEENQREREAVVLRAMKYLDNYTTWIPADGGCDEGPGYWGAAGASLFDCAELIYDMTGGAVDAFSVEHLRLMGEYEVKVNIHDSKYINFADCSTSMYPDGFLITRFGQRCGSEMLEAFGRVLTQKCSQKPSNRHVYRGIKDLMMAVDEAAEVTKAAKCVWMDGLKVMISRDSEDTSVGMFLAIKGGHNRESHNHNDVGHFIVYYEGKPVIIDPGTVSYTKDTFGSRRYTIWAMQSHYHNLPAFDGAGERNGAEFKSTREVYDEETHTLSLGLEEAYEASAGVVSYTRVANLNEGVVTIRDEIELDGVREIDFRLMTHVAPVKVEDGKISLAEGRTLIYDKSLEYELEEHDPVGADTMKHWGTEVLYRMHFRTKAQKFVGEFKIM